MYLRSPIVVHVAINVRNDQTLCNLKALSELTGRPMTAELDAAVRERLDRLRDEREQRLDRLRRIAADAAQRWGSDAEADPTEKLYDEKGLPA